MAVFKGDCSLLIDAGLGNTRRYSLRTANVTGAPTDRATWEGDADTSITLFFRNETSGAAPPGNADATFELLVYYETGTGTLVKTLFSGTAPPADGTSYTLHLTANGDAGGGARCGQLRLYIRADRDALVAYDRNSDNNGGSGTAGTGDQGIIRSNMVVSALAVSAYPAGSKFAYGTASDEQFTLTATHTQKYADRDNETFDLVVLSSDDGTERESALDVEVGAATSTAQAFTVDDTYPTGDNGHGFRFRVNNNGLLLTTEKWTRPVASGATVTQDGTNAVKRSNFYTVNPDVTLGSVTPGQSVYNREETATVTFGITNARSEALTRSMTVLVKDGAGATKKTITDTGSTYGDGGTSNYAIAATDRAAWDLTGDQWTLQGSTTGARFTNTPNAYKVSRKHLVSKTDLGATVDPLTITNAIKTGKTAGADDATVRNRGQTLHFDGYVYNVRGERLAGPTVNFNVRPTGSESYDEANDTVALSSGRFQDNYVVDTDEATGGKSLVVASQSTAAANQPRTGTAGSGNFAETDTGSPEWSVSSAYTVLVRTQKEATRNADPQDTQFTIGEDVIYEFVNVVDASGDAVVGAVYDVSQINPAGSTTQSFTGLTTSTGGWNADPGQAFDTRAPAGTGWTQRATLTSAGANNGNTGTDDQSISMLSAFTANKAIITGFGPVHGVPNTKGATLGRATAIEGDVAAPGDRVILGVAFLVDGVRTAVDASPIPAFLLARFNQSTSKVEVLQSDFSWKDQDDAGYATHFFDFKTSLEAGLEWVAQFGTAAQGVTSGVGYVTDTGDWPAGQVFMVVRAYYNSQPFYTGRAHPFHGPSARAPMDTASLPEAKILMDVTSGHHHDGANSRHSKRLFDPTGLFK
jgi:hypothetical protein